MKRFREKNVEPLGPALPLSTPWVINVDPSSMCDLRCKYCFHYKNRNPKNYGMMEWSLYRKLISDIKKFPRKLKTLRLYAFGEPMMNPLFADMVRLAKDENVSFDIDTTTNGMFLNPSRNLDIINAGIDRINLSVVGVSDSKYLEFSGRKVNFVKFVENVSHLYHNRRQCILFIKLNGDIVSTEDQEKFLEIFTPICDGIAVEHVMDCWYDFKMEGIIRNKDVGVYGQPLTKVDVCPYIFYSFCVQYDGEVSACFLDWNRKLIIGDAKKEKLKDIWNGKSLRGIRKLMLSKQRDCIIACKGCNQLEAGNPVNIDPLAKELLEKI